MTDADASYRALGYDGPLYYVLSGAKQQMAGYTAAQLMSAAGCMDIVGDVGYWADYYPRRGAPRVDWQSAGSAVMAQCVAAGLFDPNRVRGRGVWLDRDRVVVHLGDTVRGEPDDSDWIYQRRPAWVRPVDGPVSAVLEACRALPWVNPMHAELLAGWIALAPICGALRPTHMRVEGDGAIDVARACLGALAVSGEPGQDARPIITDGWIRSPGACPVLTSGRWPDATVLTMGDGEHRAVAIPHDMPGRLLARGIAGLSAIRQNIATMGPLMAGAWSLYSTEVLSAEVARGFLGRYAT